MKNRSYRKRLFSRQGSMLALSLALFGTGFELAGQPASTGASSPQADDEVFELSAFEVRADQDLGYLKTNSITASRFNAPIIELPQSISVISKEILEDVGTRNTNQMFNYSASVKSSFDSPSNPLAGDQLKIRGFGTSFIYQDSFRRRRSFHVDGIERAEIVKGPVGQYFGRTDPGGIINLISKKPLFRDETEVAVTVGSDSYLKGLIDHESVLLEDALSFRFVLSKRDSDDWMEHVTWDESYFLGTATWRANQKFDVDFQFEHFNQNRTGGRSTVMVQNKAFLDAVEAGETLPGERLRDWVVRRTNETGVSPRQFDSFYFPRGFTFNRNGPGSFDDNLGNTGTIDMSFKASENLQMRLGYSRLDSRSDAVWSVSQDPFGNAPTEPHMVWTNGGRASYTSVGYGSFQSTASDLTGGNAPAREWNENTTDSIQFDATYSARGFLGGSHRITASLEAIYDEGTQGGFLTDPSGFVKAGGFPGGLKGFGNDEGIDAEANAILAERRLEMVEMGLIGPDDPLPPNPVGILWVDLEDPTQEVPDFSIWLDGPNPMFASGNDSQDRSAALSYRGEFLEDKLILSLGLRHHEFLQTDISNDGQNGRIREGWSEFSDTLPTYGINYFLTDEVVAFANYSSSFLPVPGNINPVYRNRETDETVGGNVLAPEQGTGWDVGIKTQFWENKLVGTVSYFNLLRESLIISWNEKNIAILEENEARFNAGASADELPWVEAISGNPFIGSLRPSLRTNGGSQETDGIDMDWVWTPNKNFQAVFSYLHFFDARWKEKDPNLINVARGGLFTGRFGANDGSDAVPDKLGNVADDQISVFGKYSFTEGALSGFSVGLGGNYQSEEIHEARTNGAFVPFTSGSWVRMDAMLRYETTWREKPLSFRLAVNNVFDERYVSGRFGISPTREWSLTTRYRF